MNCDFWSDTICHQVCNYKCVECDLSKVCFIIFKDDCLFDLLNFHFSIINCDLDFCYIMVKVLIVVDFYICYRDSRFLIFFEDFEILNSHLHCSLILSDWICEQNLNFNVISWSEDLKILLFYFYSDLNEFLWIFFVLSSNLILDVVFFRRCCLLNINNYVFLCHSILSFVIMCVDLQRDCDFPILIFCDYSLMQVCLVSINCLRQFVDIFYISVNHYNCHLMLSEYIVIYWSLINCLWMCHCFSCVDDWRFCMEWVVSREVVIECNLMCFFFDFDEWDCNVIVVMVIDCTVLLDNWF